MEEQSIMDPISTPTDQKRNVTQPRLEPSRIHIIPKSLCLVTIFLRSQEDCSSRSENCDNMKKTLARRGNWTEQLAVPCDSAWRRSVSKADSCWGPSMNMALTEASSGLVHLLPPRCVSTNVALITLFYLKPYAITRSLPNKSILPWDIQEPLNSSPSVSS